MRMAECKAVLSLSAFLLLVSLPVGKTPADDIPARRGRPEVGSHWNRDGFLQIDGVPRLIIGLYELPQDETTLRGIAEHGFNLVRVPQSTSELARVHEHGLHAWICLGPAVQLRKNDAEGEQRLTRIINDFKDHPALRVWELPDEALWNIWWARFPWIFGEQQKRLHKHIEEATSNASDANVARWQSLLDQAEDYDQRGLWERAESIYDILWAELNVENPHPDWRMSQCVAGSRELIAATTRGCNVVRKLDSRHPIWQNHAPRNSIGSLRDYNQMVDAAGCDIYPVPFNYGVGHSDLKDTNLSSVGAYTDRMRQAAPGRSVWMVLQGFGWRDLSEEGREDPHPAKGRRPHYHETRFMAYDALVRGANAILYWGTQYIEKDSSQWLDLMRVAKELRALEPAIVSKRVNADPLALAEETYGSIDRQGPELMLRRAGNDWVLIAVNEYAQGLSFSVTNLPKELEGKTLHRLHSDETHLVTNATIHDGIRGFGVHVYATSRRFESR